jgi:ABC-type uncharacterized transport system ATPase subunit
MSTATPLIQLEGISKAFGPVKANQDIDLAFRAGRIKSLLGENGAGKSTLMGILAGRLQPDRGRIRVDGRPGRFRSAQDAIGAGIGMVYQHFMLVEAMTVAENVFLGYPGSVLIKPAQMEARVAALAREVRLSIDPRARVADLSMGEKQRVEILKLLFRQNRVLIFDEPTAVLTPQESDQLFEALRQLAAQNKAIVFISHKLDEVMALSDEIAVLHKGRVVADMNADQIQSKAELAQLMVGREVILQVARDPSGSAPAGPAHRGFGRRPTGGYRPGSASGRNCGPGGRRRQRPETAGRNHLRAQSTAPRRRAYHGAGVVRLF